MSPPANKLWITFGTQVRDARLGRGWNARDLATRAGVSIGMVYRVEAGQPASTDTAMEIASALGRRAELRLVDPRRRETRADLSVDQVHSAMGEFEAAHLRGLGLKVGVDEPYQHYQFARRADLVAWSSESRALLHIENRTRFPDFQEMAGSFNAKHAYLGSALAARLDVNRWRTETHVIAAIWSSEVLHALRLRNSSFKSLCPDPPAAFGAWWDGRPPNAGAVRTLVVIDPLAAGRQRQWIDQDEALDARPRYRGYADAAARVTRSPTTGT